MEEISGRERQGHRGTERPEMGEPPGADIYLGSGRGRQRVEHTVTVNGDRLRNMDWDQVQATEADGWRVQVTSRWVELCTGRGVGERVKNGRALLINGYGWESSRKDGGTNNPKNGRR